MNHTPNVPIAIHNHTYCCWATFSVKVHQSTAQTEPSAEFPHQYNSKNNEDHSDTRQSTSLSIDLNSVSVAGESTQNGQEGDEWSVTTRNTMTPPPAPPGSMVTPSPVPTPVPKSSNNAGEAPTGLQYVQHNRPPIRIDRHFHQNPSNQLKLLQLGAGAMCFILTTFCWPNAYVGYCVRHLFSFFQLFNIVCVHAFFWIATAVLAACWLFSVPDAFYRYNFPLLEKLYTGLATFMHFLATIFVLINLFRSVFSLLWIFQVGFTVAAFSLYTFDFWRKMKAENQSSRSSQ
ncbi:hypothetical protein Ddc_07173 [Ditylenchus destructor]|nr:hypothetical protein Ddc_07173 [Ditylenchus destructor]